MGFFGDKSKKGAGSAAKERNAKKAELKELKVEKKQLKAKQEAKKAQFQEFRDQISASYSDSQSETQEPPNLSRGQTKAGGYSVNNDNNSNNSPTGTPTLKRF